MKNKSLIWILLCLITVSCGEDRRKEYAAQTALTRWIEQTMRENYYWYSDMPGSGDLNYFNTPETFISKLLSTNDNSYTYVEDPTAITDLSSYGLKYDSSIRYNDSAYAVRVLYVDSDSPANDAGLERGDWLIKWNDQYIIKTRIDSLAQGNAMTLTKGVYTTYIDENENTAYTFEDGETVRVSASRNTTDSPVHLSQVYNTGSHTVGYLVYNSFDDTDSYLDQLRSVSTAFKNDGVTDVILDLRYNTGGSIDAAQLLGSILAPSAALDDVMCILTYNDLLADNNQAMNFSSSVLGSGSNLDLSKLYVIISSQTAWTSDILINSLAPYMDVITVGATSAGFYGVTHEYIHEEYPYILHLVDCLAFNKNSSIPTAGHTPTHALSESLSSAATDIYPLGDDEEILLSNTLYLIENGEMSTR